MVIWNYETQFKSMKQNTTQFNLKNTQNKNTSNVNVSFYYQSMETVSNPLLIDIVLGN